MRKATKTNSPEVGPVGDGGGNGDCLRVHSRIVGGDQVMNSFEEIHSGGSFLT